MDSTDVEEEAVPVIDLGPLLDPRDPMAVPAAELAVIRQIGMACEEWGFFQVINHGIPVHLIEEVLDISRMFFEYPAQQKMKVRGQERGGDQTLLSSGYNAFPQCGWDSYENLYYLAGPSAFNAFPEDLPEFRWVVEKLLVFLYKTAEFIESLISRSLGLPANFLEQFDGNRNGPLKLLCYSRATTPQAEIGAREHQDSSCITLVGQDESGGYQVLKDGNWVDIKPIKGALVINIGDVIQVLSNNRFKSAVHRVLNSKERRRCSFAYGSIPNPDMVVSPLPQFTTDINYPAAYTAFLYGDYMVKRIHNKTHPPTNPEDFVDISIYAV